MTYRVHPQAVVHDDCKIGAGTVIWQFASVIRKAIIGTNCSVAAYAIVDGSQIGDESIISHAAFIDPGIKIGNRVFIGPFVALCNDAWPRTNKHGFDMDKLISGEFITTIIGDGASLGAHVTILPGVRIGQNAMIAAGAVVTRSVPAGHLFRRDGQVEPIDSNRKIQRMRAVK